MLLLTFFFSCYAVCVVMALCELGQRMTDAFEVINDEFNKFDWYLLPPQIQRLLPIIIIATQQEVQLECFGSIACTRETFRGVSNILKKRQINSIQSNWIYDFYVRFSDY